MSKITKYIVLLICLTSIHQLAISQTEMLVPMSINQRIYQNNKVLKSSGEKMIDSSFIYFSDTLSLPFFDDFSRNHFQNYTKDYASPNTTSLLFHKLLDLNNTPYSANTKFSTLKTYLTEKDEVLDTIIITELPFVTVKVANLNQYPVQYQTVDLYPPYSIEIVINPLGSPDTTFLVDDIIYQDSATQFFHQLNDKNAYWLDNYVFHNYTMAKDPWTLGVATFDGLDDVGYPYAINTNTRGVADYLTSKKINMSQYSAADSVYMSFLYQNKGFGDQPEAEDSLVLEFYAPEMDQWFRIWADSGTVNSDFKKVHFNISAPQFFKPEFQFRFKNYGHLSGSLDHFHLDYVTIKAFSGYQDTLFKDFAFVYPLGSMLKDYTSVPWKHYKNNPLDKMTDQGQIVVRNGSNVPENNQNGNLEISYQGNVQNSYSLIGQTLSGGNINYAPTTVYMSYHDFSTYRFDENISDDYVVFDLKANASSQYNNPQVNDTAFGTQVFSNYYAYDDGSAEQVYELVGSQYRLAYAFEGYQSDSLIGIQINFVPSVNDISNKLFLLSVWDDNNGKPGTILYEDDFSNFRQPRYEYGLNTFAHYFFKDTVKVHVNNRFYVGWRQLDQKLSVGFDCNKINNDKLFYSGSGTSWTGSSLPGTLMIRPVFSTPLDYTLGQEYIETSELIKDFEIYPNPAFNTIQFKLINMNQAMFEVLDLQGKIIARVNNDNTLDISNLSNGIYLVKELSTGLTKKIVKQ